MHLVSEGQPLDAELPYIASGEKGKGPLCYVVLHEYTFVRECELELEVGCRGGTRLCDEDYAVTVRLE